MRPSITFARGALALAALCAAAGCNAPATNTAGNATNAASVATPNTPATNAMAPGGSDAADAKAFLVGLYAHYRTTRNNTFNMFDTNAADVFDPDTIALLKADTKALHGELGEIDGDWLCDCQDFTSIQATVNVSSATPTTAKATADFHDTGDAGRAPERDSFDLVKAGGAWRIHDMTTPGQPSLRQVLQKEIQSLGPGGRGANAIDDAP